MNLTSVIPMRSTGLLEFLGACRGRAEKSIVRAVVSQLKGSGFDPQCPQSTCRHPDQDPFG